MTIRSTDMCFISALLFDKELATVLDGGCGMCSVSSGSHFTTVLAMTTTAKGMVCLVETRSAQNSIASLTTVPCWIRYSSLLQFCLAPMKDEDLRNAPQAKQGVANGLCVDGQCSAWRWGEIPWVAWRWIASIDRYDTCTIYCRSRNHCSSSIPPRDFANNSKHPALLLRDVRPSDDNICLITVYRSTPKSTSGFLPARLLVCHCFSSWVTSI